MLDVAFAAAAAAAAAVGTLALARTARALGVRVAASMTGAMGLVVGPAVALVVEGVPSPAPESVAWAFAAGGLSLVGNGLFLASAQRLEIALVAPIVASAGAVAALVATAFGAAPGGWTLLAGAVLTIGVIVTARGTAGPQIAVGRRSAIGVQLAVASAVSLGLSYLAIGEADKEIGGAWAYVALMCLTFLIWTVPTWFGGRMRVPARWWCVIGIAELSGAAVFVLLGRAAASSPVVASLIYSQYAVVAMVVALVVWRERPSAVSLIGAALALIGTFGILLGAGAR